MSTAEDQRARAIEAVNARRRERGQKPKCEAIRPDRYCKRLAGHTREHHWVIIPKPTEPSGPDYRWPDRILNAGGLSGSEDNHD